MDALESFTTERLIATSFRESDLTLLCRLHQDPQVMETLGGPRSEETTKRFLTEKMAHWTAHGFGYWMFRERQTGQFIGRGGLQHVLLEGHAEIEVGYTVAAPYWGRGFATEMASALVNVGFQQLQLSELVCFTLTTNLASQRVMEKVGFTFERNFIHVDEPHVLYRTRSVPT